MIRVPFPHMALNAIDAPGEEYEMWNTWRVPESESVTGMVNWIATVARDAPGGKLETLIFNGHGKPGKIFIGQGIRRQDVKTFNVLKGLVVRIWIVACHVAKIKKAGTITDGNYFCYRLAQESGAFVIASSVKQKQVVKKRLVNRWHGLYVLIDKIPRGHIDNWERPIHCWNPKGELVSFYAAYHADMDGEAL